MLTLCADQFMILLKLQEFIVETVVVGSAISGDAIDSTLALLNDLIKGITRLWNVTHDCDNEGVCCECY